jgi:plastocyanin
MSTPTDQPDVANTSGSGWREWMMVAVGITALMSILAIVVAVVALSSSSTQTVTAAATPAAATAPATSQATGQATSTAGTPATTTAGATAGALQITMRVKPDDQHAKKGPDGQWHDAFLPADVTVRAGAPVQITFLNYDTSAHSFNSPSLGVNQVIPAGDPNHPKSFTVSFTAPKTGGSYQWYCALPCDPWAMTHDGFMRGFVKVIA